MILLFLLHLISSTKNSTMSQLILHENESECLYERNFTETLYSNSVICLVKCTFNSIKSSLNGGSLIVSLRNRFGTTNIIDNCVFMNCQSNAGSAIYFNIEVISMTTINNSIFDQNSAISDSGGSIYFKTQVKCNFNINNCTFSSNSAIGAGGSIYFKNNYDKNSSSNSISCSTFNANIASTDNDQSLGGAIIFLNSHLLLDKCTFKNNTSHSKYNDACGGAISFIESTVICQNCQFINNLAKYIKYAIYYDSLGGAISFLISSEMSLIETFENCLFDSNTAYSDCHSSLGGAISFHKGNNYMRNQLNINVTFSNSSFNNNVANSSSFSSSGGAIYVSFSYIKTVASFTFVDSSFSNNLAYSYSSSSRGGSVYFERVVEGSFVNCNFNHNVAETFLNEFLMSGDEPRSLGGAISLSISNIYFNDCLFENNVGLGNSPKHVSTSKGGALFSENSNVQIHKSIFLNNTLCNFGHKFDIDCYIEGGSCYFFESGASISECSFKNNTAMLRASEKSIFFSARICGGAVYFNSIHHEMKCTNCSFKDNLVHIPDNENKEFAGAVYLTKGSLNNCIFNDNIAYNGCDLRFDQIENSSLSLVLCNFEHNKNNHKIKSLIHCRIKCNTSSANIFAGNKIETKVSLYLFDGEFEVKSSVIKFYFSKNCVSPFERELYKSNEIMIYNEIGKELVSFESAFDPTCSEYIFSQTEQAKTCTSTQTMPLVTQTEQVKTQTQAMSFVTQSNSATGNNAPYEHVNKYENFKKIFIILITANVILMVLVLAFVALTIFLLYRRRNHFDMMDNLIEEA